MAFKMHITRNRNTETRSSPAVTRHIHSYFSNKILPCVLALSIDAAITDLFAVLRAFSLGGMNEFMVRKSRSKKLSPSVPFGEKKGI